ncbi:MAG: hypothetical protein AB7I50_21995 [Vicinamibacterales bacterium]
MGEALLVAGSTACGDVVELTTQTSALVARIVATKRTVRVERVDADPGIGLGVWLRGVAIGYM